MHETSSESQAKVSTVAAVPEARAISTPRLTLPSVNPGQLVGRFRAWVNASYAKHERRWEASMSAVGIASTLGSLVMSRLPSDLRGGASWLLTLVAVLFAVEYAGRLLASPDRRWFVRDHVPEFVAVLPWLHAVRVVRLIWVLWLRGVVERVRTWRSRPLVVPTTGGGSRLAIAWIVLLVLAGFATYAYVSDIASAGSDARFALVVMLLCVFSGLTAAMATASAGRAFAPSQVPERLRALEELKAASLITAEEYGSRRAMLLDHLAAVDEAARYATTPHVKPRKDPAVQASGAS